MNSQKMKLMAVRAPETREMRPYLYPKSISFCYVKTPLQYKIKDKEMGQSSKLFPLQARGHNSNT